MHSISSGDELPEGAYHGREKAVKECRIGLHIRRKSLPGLQQTWTYGLAAVTNWRPLNRKGRDANIWFMRLESALKPIELNLDIFLITIAHSFAQK